jgi:pimeloyl-ACP methyl ester carboxylesterase
MPPAKHRVPKKAPPKPYPTTPPEVVDPVWLAKALGLSLLAALVCAWLTLCLLFYQGEWQLVLHPSHTVDRTPASAGLSFQEVRFDAAETGQPRLTGWWIPAEANSQPSFQTPPKYAALTVLYLHDGSQSLSATVPSLARLHQAGINVFAIDYRGFGESDSSAHPTEARMAQDSAAALDYLTATRHIPVANIIPYGVGLGASLATNLALRHSQITALILDNPDPDPTATAVALHSSRVIPVRLIFRERFEIARPLAALLTPKLLIAGGPSSAHSPSNISALQMLFRQAHSPSLSVTLPSTGYEDAYQAALSRFLDQYATSPIRLR